MTTAESLTIPATQRETPLALIGVALCAFAMVAEGFDNYSIGFAAPLIMRDWGTNPATLGVLFAANVITSAIGTMAIGPIADRRGRKPCLIVALLLFGTATIATAHVANVLQLALVRTLSSLALGASVPLVLALASDVVIPTRRATVAAIMSSSIALGIVASSLSAAAIVPTHGWPPLMYVGGLLAFAVALPVQVIVREPMRDSGRAIVRPGEFRALFDPARWRATVICVTGLTVIFAVSFFFNYWLPSLLQKVHPDMRDVALVTALAQGMSPVGAFITGRAMDRHGMRALAAALTLAAVGLTAAVTLATGFVGLGVAVCCTLLLVNGAFGGAMAAPVYLFPTELRATALGFSVGVGRLIGGSAGPALGGWMLAKGLPPTVIAVSFAPPLLLAAAVALRFAHRVNQRDLQ